MDKNKSKKGKILAFQQDVDFFLKRGTKELDRNDLLSAVQHYRKAHEEDPNDLDSCLALAQALCQMQRFEESNRLLLVDMGMNSPDPESYFGLACNYYGLHEYRLAQDSLKTYLELEPDGYYAYDAEDFLDLLEDDEALSDTVRSDFGDAPEILHACQHARYFMEQGDTAASKSVLEQQLAQEPNNARMLNQLSVIAYCEGDAAQALALADSVLAREPQNVQARCNRILFLHSRHISRKEEAERELDQLQTMRLDEADELSSLSLLQIEFERYTEALQTLSRLLLQVPYDSEIIHRIGYCKYLTGDVEGAVACYRKLLRIDPDDTVARYYLGACRKYEAKTHARHWSLPYRVPMAEAFRRFQRINSFMESAQEKLFSVWQSDREVRNLFVWALSIPDHRCKISILRLIAAMADTHAERILRDFLLRTDQPDEAKQEAMLLLTWMNAAPPYMAYLAGRWVQGSVNKMKLPEKLPSAYQSVLKNLTVQLIPNCSEKVAHCTIGILQRYLTSLEGNCPRISVNQQQSFAAALDLLGRCDAGEDPSEEEIARKYHVSLLRLHNAMHLFEPYREGR